MDIVKNTEKIDAILNHTDSFIKGFFYGYRWLSNFHVCDVFYDGMMYPSSEAAYQSAKSEDPYIKEIFQKLTPREAQKHGKVIKCRDDWENIKKDVMYKVLLDKFTRHDDLMMKLIETGDKYLEETNYWNDKTWGVCNGKGNNWLGELLMIVRKDIQ